MCGIYFTCMVWKCNINQLSVNLFTAIGIYIGAWQMFLVVRYKSLLSRAFVFIINKKI